jgi:glycosyltransferase involved in cell wall biosynthesis
VKKKKINGTTTRLKISMLIPVHNETKRLEGCVTKLEITLRNLSINFEVIIVDNKSINCTDKVAHELSNEDSAGKHLHNTIYPGAT